MWLEQTGSQHPALQTRSEEIGSTDLPPHWERRGRGDAVQLTPDGCQQGWVFLSGRILVRILSALGASGKSGSEQEHGVCRILDWCPQLPPNLVQARKKNQNIMPSHAVGLIDGGCAQHRKVAWTRRRGEDPPMGECLPGALLLDYVPPEEPPSTPLGNALRIR